MVSGDKCATISDTDGTREGKMDWVYIVVAFVGGVLVALLIVYLVAKQYTKIMRAIEEMGKRPLI